MEGEGEHASERTPLCVSERAQPTTHQRSRMDGASEAVCKPSYVGTVRKRG